MILDQNYFQNCLKTLPLEGVSRVAVAVSGGPDSMALGFMLAHFTDFEVHVLSVDHGLRIEAADEVAMVGEAARAWGAEFTALKWEHEGVESRLHEGARAARYDLMGEYCKTYGIAHLFLGHHRDDQAETFLFRLAKGSGLDGLASMREVQDFEGLSLVRPLLGVDKADLIEFCRENGVRYLNDPSNENATFARVRLREARDILEAEGLSAKRLSVTARRLARARDALEEIADRTYQEALINKNTKHTVLNLKILEKEPEEIVLRCVLKVLAEFRPDADYAPRMEKVEALVSDLLMAQNFRKRTLGGLVFERDDVEKQLIIKAEG